MNHTFETDVPENQGVSSCNILDFIDICETRDLGVNTFMLLRNNKLLCRFCKKPYEPENPQILWSLTKSFTAVAIGIAHDQGLLNLDDPVVSFFPDKAPAIVSENLSRLTIRHLLTMSSGLAQHSYYHLFYQPDWLSAYLAQNFPLEPGTYYCYNTHDTYMLSAIIERMAGVSLHEYLGEYLFRPLEIMQSTWETSAQEITLGGMGLNLTTEAVAKFGQMLLDKGLFNGMRIVSAAYVDAMTSVQIDSYTAESRLCSSGYGYQIHIGPQGDFTNGGMSSCLIVAPRKNMVIALTTAGRGLSNMVTELLYEKFINALECTPHAVIEDSAALARQMDTLSFPVPEFLPVPANAPKLDCAYLIDTFLIDARHSGLRRVALSAGTPDTFTMQLHYNNGQEPAVLNFDFTRPVTGRTCFIKDLRFCEQKYVAYAAWQNAGELALMVYYLETPYIVTYRLKLRGNKLRVEFAMQPERLPSYNIMGVMEF